MRLSRLRHIETHQAYDAQRWAARNGDGYRASARARYAADGTGKRESVRRYLARADRSCRHKAGGCEELAKPDSKYCLEHHRADIRRRRAAKRSGLMRRLAQQQGWVCTWCGERLPDGLAHVWLDHIIPVTSGLVLDEEWNYQALHRRCNQAKADKITEQAVALARARGLALAA